MSIVTPPIFSLKPVSSFTPFSPLRRWLNQLEITDRRFAHLVCRVIPCCCPFERDLSIFGRVVHIPALCKLNPVYTELVSLRLRSLAYLADICSEDTTPYIY